MIIQIFHAWLIVAFSMTVFWGIYRFTYNPSIVDLGWVVVILIAGLFYIFHYEMNFRRIIIASLLFIWGARLGGYILITRLLKGKIDKRYIELSENWTINQSLGFFLNYQLQAVLSLFISIVFLFSASASFSNPTLLDICGFIIILIGITCEALSDRQLHLFKQSQTKGVCNRGFWEYSRHPNYFFEWLTWLGFSVVALSATNGFLAFISPLSLYLIMRYLTIPITEASSLRSRGEAYEKYQARTPVFFPKLKVTKHELQ